MKIRLSTIILIISATAGCGVFNNSRTTAPALQTAPGRVTLSGKVYLPDGIQTAGKTRGAARAQSALGGATVSIYSMNKDGILESVSGAGPALTGVDGSYEMLNVPPDENMILVAKKTITSGSSQVEVSLKAVISVDDVDAGTGEKQACDIDIASTLAVVALREIIVAANETLTDGNKIAAAGIARETIEKIRIEADAALDADQAGDGDVNLMTVLSGDAVAAAQQLNALSESAGGAGLKAQLDSVGERGGLRVTVKDEEGAAVKDANIILTRNGEAENGATDEKGNAFFGDLPLNSVIYLEIFKTGYMMAHTNKTIESAYAPAIAEIELKSAQENQPPISKVGDDQTVIMGASVTLDGSGSYDPDGDEITYLWSQTSGAGVTLNNATIVNPSFSAATPGTLIFSLTVSDGSLSSDAATVTITVQEVICSSDSDCDDGSAATTDTCLNPGTATSSCQNENCSACSQNSDCEMTENQNGQMSATCENPGTCDAECVYNHAPVSNAGDDQTVLQGASVTLDGSGGYDPDGDAITYLWSQTSGAGVTLNNATIVNPSFSAATPGTLIFSLTVSDGVLSNNATVTITVQEVICSSDSDCDDGSAATTDTCLNPGTAPSSCQNENCSACSQNSDCEMTENQYGHVWPTCANAGTCDSVCIYKGSACVDQTLYSPYSNSIECTLDSFCDDGDPATVDTCVNPGACGAQCVNEICSAECSSNAECDDGNALTTDVCENIYTCSKACVHTACTPACVTDADCPQTTPFSTEVCNNPNSCDAVCVTQ